MSKSTTNPNPVKRSLRLVRPPHPTAPGKIVITQEVRRQLVSTTYLVTCLESDLGGRAFQLAKVGTETDERGDRIVSISERYNVLLAGDRSTCDCKDMTYRGHNRPCKHILCLTTLASMGKLDAPVMSCESAPRTDLANKCCVCHSNPVNPLDGEDTCYECLAQQ